VHRKMSLRDATLALVAAATSKHVGSRHGHHDGTASAVATGWLRGDSTLAPLCSAPIKTVENVARPACFA
jgi:hypothetical protein